MASPVDIGHSYYMNDIQNTIYIAYIISCILILLQVRYECVILGESWGSKACQEKAGDEDGFHGALQEDGVDGVGGENSYKGTQKRLL